MRAGKGRDVDAMNLFAGGDIDHRERVTGRGSRAVIGGDRELAIGGGNDFVRVGAGGRGSEDFSIRRIDDGDRAFLIEDQQRGLLRGGERSGGEPAGRSE